MAVDSGQPTLSSKATVHIEIADVNDHRPEWQEFSGVIEVWENATLGEWQGNLTRPLFEIILELFWNFPELFEIVFVLVRHKVPKNLN